MIGQGAFVPSSLPVSKQYWPRSRSPHSGFLFFPTPEVLAFVEPEVISFFFFPLPPEGLPMAAVDRNRFFSLRAHPWPSCRTFRASLFPIIHGWGGDSPSSPPPAFIVDPSPPSREPRRSLPLQYLVGARYDFLDRFMGYFSSRSSLDAQRDLNLSSSPPLPSYTNPPVICEDILPATRVLHPY